MAESPGERVRAEFPPRIRPGHQAGTDQRPGPAQLRRRLARALSRRQEGREVAAGPRDDLGNLEQPETRLDQPAALHAAATAAAREGLAVRIDDSPRALPQFDRDLESFPPEVLLRLRKACADATGVARGPGYALSGRMWTDSGRKTHAGSKDRGVATVRTRPRRPHDVVSLTR